jgi:CheY-like chemotaxis protein
LSSDTRFRVFLRIDAVIGFDIAMNAQSVRILIADDNEVARGSLSELLSNHDGWEVCAAVENGEQAVLKASELKPNLVILDLAMPVKDGLRATREIGQILPSVPIVIYTMHDSSWLELEARKAGARYMVAKTQWQPLLTRIPLGIKRLLPNRRQSRKPHLTRKPIPMTLNRIDKETAQG